MFSFNNFKFILQFNIFNINLVGLKTRIKTRISFFLKYLFFDRVSNKFSVLKFLRMLNERKLWKNEYTIKWKQDKLHVR